MYRYDCECGKHGLSPNYMSGICSCGNVQKWYDMTTVPNMFDVDDWSLTALADELDVTHEELLILINIDKKAVEDILRDFNILRKE